MNEGGLEFGEVMVRWEVWVKWGGVDEVGSVSEVGSDAEEGAVGFWGNWGDGIGVVGVDLELGSRRVGVDGVGDTGDVSGGCTSKNK